MLKPETKVKNGAYLARFVFDASEPTDHSDELVNYLSTDAVRMGMQHITIECEGGIPFWLERAVRKLAGFGMPISITGTSVPPALAQALSDSVGPYNTVNYSW